jgi:hypothetical protein
MREMRLLRPRIRDRDRPSTTGLEEIRGDFLEAQFWLAKLSVVRFPDCPSFAWDRPLLNGRLVRTEAWAPCGLAIQTDC